MIKKLALSILILSIIASSFCGEHEVNRFLKQESKLTPEYQAKLDKLVSQLKQDKLNGVEVADEDKIHIHIVSHSHDDVGFRKTLDQYYSGSEDMIIRAGVQYVLDETIQHLIEDPTKKFTYVEMAFFTRWWRNQDDQMKDNVKKLVQEGRLEFINGGWSMNDEAATHYEDIITNMQKGHKFLLDNFGVTPNIGWHIDPFGHSNAQAALFSRMGFDAWYMCRIDYRDKNQRREDKNLEFVWTPFKDDSGKDDAIFTHTTYDMYWGIPNFYFGDSRVEEPIVVGWNLEERLDEFAKWVMIIKESFHSNHVFVPMGGDFNYQNAHTIFMNLDKLIKHFNEMYNGMEVFYSTPGEYIKAAMEDEEIEWEVNEDDFFPYADDQYSYWTGFFTSRSNQKGYIRQSSAQYMAANQFLTLQALRSDSIKDAIDQQEKLEDAVGIAQHHDAATGTSKQAVADDYLDYLYTGIKASEEAELEALKSVHNSDIDWVFCDVTNATYHSCPIVEGLSKNKKVALTVTNPSSMTRTNEVVKIKVPPGVNLTVEDANFPSLDVYSDLVCSQTYTYEGYVDDCDLFILVNSINALSTKTFVVMKHSKKEDDKAESSTTGYDRFTLSYDEVSTTRFRVGYGRCYHEDCETHEFNVEYNSYDSYEGDGQKGGLYIFRDNNNGAGNKPYSKIDSIEGYVGRVVSVVTVKGDTVDSQVIIYNHADVQTATVVSRVKGIDSDHGKEITVNFIQQDIKTDKFYTDSNGMIMEERILNHREHYELTNFTGYEVVGNFYPVNAAVTLRTDEDEFMDRQQFTVLNDRAQSASSLESGEIEFLIHRRTMFDDDRGVEEPLNETTSDGTPIIVQTYHHVISASVADLHNHDYMETKKLQRLMVEEPLQVLYADYKGKEGFENLLSNEKNLRFGYIGSLSPSLKIVTKPLGDNKIMLRFYNMNEKFDGLEKFQTVDMSGVLGDLLQLRVHDYTSIPIEIFEWNLSLNQMVGNMQKVDWIIEDGKAHYNGRTRVQNFHGDENLIHLANQEMRTFVVKFGENEQSITKTE